MFGRTNLQLIQELSEARNVISHGGCLFDMEELANKGLMPIAIKTIMDLGAEIIPSPIRYLVLDRLVPQGCRTIKMHLGDTDPKGGVDEVHFEVLLGTGTPTTGIVTVETRKRDFR
jgi:hypothetical protein